MTHSLIQLGNGTLAQVSVYRNGDTVTVRGAGQQMTPAGPVTVAVQAQMSIVAYEWARDQAIRRIGLMAYSRIVGHLGIDDDARRAPPLPGYTPPPRPLLRR